MSGSISSPFAIAPQRDDFMHRLPPGNLNEDQGMVIQPPSGSYPTYSVPDGAVRQASPTEDQGWMPVSAQQPDFSWLFHPMVLSAIRQHLTNLFSAAQNSPYSLASSQGDSGSSALPSLPKLGSGVSPQAMQKTFDDSVWQLPTYMQQLYINRQPMPNIDPNMMQRAPQQAPSGEFSQRVWDLPGQADI